MQKPKLGIVVPHYNQYDTLYMSVRTLLESNVDMKIVVVDDGSAPSLVCAPPIPDKVTVININPNHGVQVARNTGFNYLLRYHCEFILFSDSDVTWKPHALDKLVGALLKGSYAYCNWHWGDKEYVSKPFNGLQLQESNYISTMSVIKTNELLRYAGVFPFDESLTRLQDWDLWLTLLNEGCTGIHVPECLFSTPFSEGGISNSPGYQEAVNAVTKKHHL